MNLPAGRELPYPGAANAVGGALVGLTFDDVKPAKGMDFSHAAQLVTRTFDGLTVIVKTVQQKNDYWATISAQAAPGKAAAEKQAQAHQCENVRLGVQIAAGQRPAADDQAGSAAEAAASANRAAVSATGSNPGRRLPGMSDRAAAGSASEPPLFLRNLWYLPRLAGSCGPARCAG